MLATPVKNAVVIEAVQRWDDLTLLTVAMDSDDYHEYARLPKVVEFKGRFFGKSSWNSDVRRAYYRSDMSIATGK